MDIAGTYTFDAPPDRVWALLMELSKRVPDARTAGPVGCGSRDVGRCLVEPA